MEFKLVLNRFFICGILFAALIFSGCVSAQKDVSISVEDTANAGISLGFEERLIKLDGSFILNKKLNPTQLQEAASICAGIDSALAAPMIDKVTESRLLALKGRTQLLTGNKTEAAKLYSAASKKFANDAQLKILGRRLGQIENISKYKAQIENEAITIEAAIESFENGDYDIATGLFDSAFLASNGFYQNAYSAVRARAWDLKNVAPSDGDIAFWSAPKITVAQMLQLAQRQAGLLDKFTGGKKLDSKRLFQTIQKSGALDAISQTPEQHEQNTTPLLENNAATRIIAARFLWNLYASRRSVDATKYSARYRSRTNAKSPVADVDIYSEDFDAVLGVIEKEIMSLVDGKNFNPQGTVTAPEFDESLKKIQ